MNTQPTPLGRGAPVHLGTGVNALRATTAAILTLLVVASCSTDQGARFARAWSISYTDGGGSMSSRGGFKSDEGVLRGSMDTDASFHATTLTFDVGAAFVPDPDAHAMRLALEQVLRARAEEHPKYVVPDEPRAQERPKWEAPSESTSPVAPVTPKPEDCGSSQASSEAGAAIVDTPARPVLPLASIETLSDGRRIVLVDGRVALELDPYEPFRDPAPTPNTAEQPHPDPTPSKPAVSTLTDPAVISALAAVALAVIAKIAHRRHKRRKHAAATSKEPVR